MECVSGETPTCVGTLFVEECNRATAIVVERISRQALN